MNKGLSAVYVVLLLIFNYTLTDARIIRVERIQTSSAFKVDLDWSIYTGVTYLSTTGVYNPVNIEFAGAPLNAGLSLEFSISNKFYTLPVKLGFDAGFSHVSYCMTEYELEDLKGPDRVRGVLHIDRLPLCVYLQTNSTLIYGIGFYDKVLLRGKVLNDRYTLNLLDDTCFRTHMYGLEFRMGGQFERLRFVYYMSFGFVGEFDVQKIAERNRSHADVDSEISGGVRISFLLGSNYSPKRKMRFLFKYE